MKQEKILPDFPYQSTFQFFITCRVERKDHFFRKVDTYSNFFVQKAEESHQT